MWTVDNSTLHTYITRLQDNWGLSAWKEKTTKKGILGFPNLIYSFRHTQRKTFQLSSSPLPPGSLRGWGSPNNTRFVKVKGFRPHTCLLHSQTHNAHTVHTGKNMSSASGKDDIMCMSTTVCVWRWVDLLPTDLEDGRQKRKKQQLNMMSLSKLRMVQTFFQQPDRLISTRCGTSGKTNAVFGWYEKLVNTKFTAWKLQWSGRRGRIYKL